MLVFKGILLLAATAAMVQATTTTTTTTPEIDCESPTALDELARDCMRQENIKIALDPQKRSANLVFLMSQNELDHICSYPRDSLRRAMECIGEVNNRCVSTDSRMQAFTLTPKQMADIMLKMCDNKQDIDLECVEREVEAEKRCLESYITERASTEDDASICWVYDAAFQCVKQTYSVCSCKTAQVLSDLIVDILTPATCHRKLLDDNRVTCPDQSKPLSDDPSSVPAAGMVTPVPTPSCTSVSDLKASAVKCFRDEGIVDSSLFSDFLHNPVPADSIVESLMDKRGDEICGSLSLASKAALKCVMNVIRSCLDGEMKDLITSPEKAGDYIDMLCKHRQEINFSCVSKKTEALLTCGKRKGLAYTGDLSMKSIVCFAQRGGFECAQEVLKTCGCQTARVYSDMLLEMRFPSYCQDTLRSLQGQHLVCGTDNLHRVVLHGIEKGRNQGDLGYRPHHPAGVPSCDQVEKHVLQCYTDRNLISPEQSLALGHSTGFLGTALELAIVDHLDSMCSTKEVVVKEAAICEASIHQYCATPSTKWRTLDAKRILAIFERFCNERQDLNKGNIRLFNTQTTSIEHCKDIITDDLFTSLDDPNGDYSSACNLLISSMECAKEAFMPSTCKTTRFYSHLVYETLPDVCQQPSARPRRLQCDDAHPYRAVSPDGDTDDGGNGAGYVIATFWSLVASFALARTLPVYM